MGNEIIYKNVISERLNDRYDTIFEVDFEKVGDNDGRYIACVYSYAFEMDGGCDELNSGSFSTLEDACEHLDYLKEVFEARYL